MIVFICSPYAHNINFNERQARKYCRFAVNNKANPVCPHLFYPQFLEELNPEHRKLGISLGIELMHFCDELWVFTKHGISKGMSQEIEYWKSKFEFKPIKYFSE